MSPMLALAVRAAKAAGEVIRNGSGQLNVVEQKGVGDLVSQVDRDADRAAIEVIRSASLLPILSEELNSNQAECDDMWIVDPLDATSAFLMQAGPHYPSTLIALREGGRTTLGVVLFPLTNECFYAERGFGAWQDGERIVCDSDEVLSEVWVEMNQYGDAAHETAYFAELRDRLRSFQGARLVTTNVPHSGVAVRIAADTNPLAVAIHDNRSDHIKQAPWDVAAPQVILEGAGGVFVNPAGERTNPFCAEPIIVARSAKLAEQVVRLQLRQSA